jgi:hypothetical protein
MTQAIKYTFTDHRGRACIAVQFEFNSAWNKRMQQVAGAKWSKTLQAWMIPDTPDNRKKCGLDLSVVLLDILRKYIQAYKPKPRIYLFESEQTLSRYPVRTVQQIFSNAKQKAGIRKEVGIHSLRHSFATHCWIRALM